MAFQRVKYNADLICSRKQRKVIYKGLKQGISILKMMEYLGLTQKTFEVWLNKGLRKEKEFSRFRVFRKEYLKIKNQKIANAVGIIEKMAKGGTPVTETKVLIKQGRDGRYKEITKTVKELAPQWTAAAWWLERNHPEDFGLKREDNTKQKSAEDFAIEINQALSAIEKSVPKSSIPRRNKGI